VKLNQRDPRLYRDGLSPLNAAYKVDECHPVVLSILATYYHFIGDYQLVLNLAQIRIGFIETAQLKSHSCYKVARVTMEVLNSTSPRHAIRIQ